jgi:PKD repeat protein
MNKVYEMFSTGYEDNNVLTVDFTFSNEVGKDEAIQLIDSMVSMLDDSTNSTAKELLDHMPTFFVKSRWSKEEE